MTLRSNATQQALGKGCRVGRLQVTWGRGQLQSHRPGAGGCACSLPTPQPSPGLGAEARELTVEEDVSCLLKSDMPDQGPPAS